MRASTPPEPIHSWGRGPTVLREIKEHGRYRMGYFHKTIHTIRYPGYHRIEIDELPMAQFLADGEVPTTVDMIVRSEWVPERVEGSSTWVEE